MYYFNDSKMGRGHVRDLDKTPYQDVKPVGDASATASAQEGVIHYGKMRPCDRVSQPDGFPSVCGGRNHNSQRED